MEQILTYDTRSSGEKVAPCGAPSRRDACAPSEELELPPPVEFTRRRLPNPQQAKPGGHGVEEVDVIGGGVARVAAHVKVAGVYRAELLHSHWAVGLFRAVGWFGATVERQVCEEVVGAFGGAGVCAGKDFGVCDDKSFSAGDCCAGEGNKDVDV